MNVVVTGGAGYIGSHAVRQLIEAGHRAVVVDNLYRGHAQAVDRRATFHKIDLADTQALTDVLAQEKIDCVMQFAALTYVGESVADPLAYYGNNTMNTCALLDTAVQSGVRQFIFSSTAAVYGNPETSPIRETAVTAPISPLWARTTSCAIESPSPQPCLRSFSSFWNLAW